MSREREQVIRDFVRSWFRKAEGDFQAASYLLVLEQEDYFPVAFHAQQAAEKFLKCLLVRYQIPFPKTHDIERLLTLLEPALPGITTELASSVMLTPFGVDFRYPGELLVDRETAEEALREAEQVRATVIRHLEEYLTED